MSIDAREDGSFVPDRKARARRQRRAVSGRLRRAFRAVASRFSSSLTRRIVFLNIGGLVALLLGFLYLNQFREGLIDVRLENLQSDGEIIAAAIASSAAGDSDSVTIDPDKLLNLAPGQSQGLDDESDPSLEFSINPDRVGPLLQSLVLPTRTRAEVYDRDGFLLLDSRTLNMRSTIQRRDLGPVGQPDESGPSFISRVWDGLVRRLSGVGIPLEQDAASDDGKSFPEVASALAGSERSVVRINRAGETIISIAVPIQRFRTVRGALLLETQGSDIDKMIAAERWGIFRIFLVSAAVMLLLSLLLAGTIAEPMRRLAEAAERVRRGTKSRQEIPDFTERSDEIGHLSGALRDMTGALYNRIEAIERFAADVAHELKNPLTSLRSAVETLPMVHSDESRGRLLDVIQHDVRRLDRLISDISDASRLDAELARGDSEPIDVARLLQAVVSMANQVKPEEGVTVELTVVPGGSAGRHGEDFIVMGRDSRLGQVVTNLVDNARSFSPQGGSVRITLRHGTNPGQSDNTASGIEITVDDDGPGIPAHAFERIFERFYTDRPSSGFGQNSGLGLSISRQIVEAHGGEIWAENRLAPGSEEDVIGARFVVWLPAAR